jgi:26S proteasome regulatory subunit N9
MNDVKMTDSKMSATEYLAKERSSNPSERQHFDEIEAFYSKKLWDQLSKKINDVVNLPFFKTHPTLIRMYDQFVRKFEKKINPIRLVTFASAVSQQYTNPAEGLTFLESVAKTVEEDKQAVCLTKLEMLRRKMQMGKVDDCKAGIEEAKTAIDAFGGIMEPIVHSIFHLTALEYHKSKNNAQDFFNHSILYLTYTPLSNIPKDQQIALAADVGRAALVGRNTYNFGELLQHPVLNVLKGGQHEWIYHILFACNAGDLAKFRAIFKTESKTQEVLARNEQFLNEKLRIMAFMELVFRKETTERRISFKEVAQHCDVKEEEVEFLLLKAFSLKVVKGVIDQVDQTVRVTWVQPRVLDLQQVASIRDRLKAWASEVHQTAILVENQAPELLKPTLV